MVSQSISLDFIKSGPPKMLFAKQGDGGSREISAALYENGIEYTPAASATVEFAFKKESGKKIKTAGSIYIGNVIKATLTEDMLDEPGLGECVFTIHEANPLTTQTFYVRVESSPNYEATPSGDFSLQSKYVDPSLEAQMVFADAGFDGLSSVEVGAIRPTEQTTPTISIDQSTGKITSEAFQPEGYVVTGKRTKTLQLPTVAGQTVTAGATKRLIAAAGTYATGDIYVAADSSPTFITQPDKTVNVTSDANGNISPAYVVADSPYDALGRVNLAFSGGAINASKIKKGEKILGVTGTYEGSGGGSSIETVPVTILSSDYMKDTVDVLYTGLDDNSQPAQKTLYVTHTGELTYTINVVKGTTLMVQDNTGDYDIGYDTQSGFLSVDDFGNAVVCRVGDVACSITPAQVERASGESGNSIIVGKWTFHSSITQYPPESGIDVNFKCEDGTECNRIATSVANGTWQMVYFDAADGSVFDAVVDGQFDDASVQTIDFGTEPQTIPAEFAEWLAANADYKASGGGSAIETCTIEFDGSNGLYTGQMFYTAVENGVAAAKFEIDFSTPATFTVVKGSYLRFVGSVPSNNGNITDVDGYSGSMSSGDCKITGDVTFYC